MSIRKLWRSGAQVTNGWSVEAKLAYWSDLGPNGCIEWKGTKNWAGYGRLIFNGSMKLAHRAAFEAVYGPTPLHILHNCDNPACINVDHLRPGTDADNHADMLARNRACREYPKNRGERHVLSKLTTADVIAILVDNRQQRTIAKDYGVSQTKIGQIKRGLSWKHITAPNPLDGTRLWDNS